MTDTINTPVDTQPSITGSGALYGQSDAEIQNLVSVPGALEQFVKTTEAGLDDETTKSKLDTAAVTDNKTDNDNLDLDTDGVGDTDDVDGEEAKTAANLVAAKGKEDSATDENLIYKTTHEELFKPFKANGREMTVDSIEEARKLMQQGANYHQNMQEFKPFKKAMAVLKQRGALDPEKLNFLLDVQEGKPEAIAKLLTDIKVDPLDIDIRKSGEYKSDYVDNEPVDNLTVVLDSLESGEHKIKTLNVLSDKGWDADSRKRLFSNPEGIKVLNKQIQSGIYDKIMSALNKQRALGELLDKSDLDAYNIVGSDLEKQGKLGVPKPSDSASTKNGNEDKLDKAKKAGGSPRPVASNESTPEAFNPYTATIEEVDKFIADQKKKSASKG